MSKRAKQRALEAYPDIQFEDERKDDLFDDINQSYSVLYRSIFLKGYEQAEKDFAELLKERIKTYDGIYEENKAYGGDTESTAEVLKELKSLLQDYEKDNTI